MEQENGSGIPDKDKPAKPEYSVDLFRQTGRMARKCAANLPDNIADMAEATAIGTLCARLVEKNL